MSRIVPWMCREEWLTTFQNLYNFQDIKLQTKGIKRVQAWKSRSHHKLPLSIEATASLVAASVSDVEECQESPLTVRLAMAMAIVRFVNGMVDMEQKGVYARSVQSIADDIGLPDWLVDLRHEATHAALPSLEVLRAGCRFSLDWLRTHYWDSQTAEIQARDEKLLELVQNFIAEFERNWSKTENKKNKRNKNTGIIKEIVELISDYNMWDAVLDLLLGKLGLLIPSSETLKEFASYWPDISEQSPANTSMGLPKRTLCLWSPLFKALHKENDTFLSKLVSMLIQKVRECEHHSESILLVRYVSCWAYFILLVASDQHHQEVKQWKIKPELNYGAILEVTLQSYSSYTPVFLRVIINNLQLSDKAKEKLMKFCAFTLETPDFERSATEEKVIYGRLVKNFPRLADHAKSRLERPTEPKNADWQLCDHSFTRSVPLGGLIGCESMQFERLELHELDSMQVETDAVDQTPTEPEADNCTISCDVSKHLEDERFPEMLCDASDTSKELTRDAIENISQKIWMF